MPKDERALTNPTQVLRFFGTGAADLHVRLSATAFDPLQTPSAGIEFDPKLRRAVRLCQITESVQRTMSLAASPNARSSAPT